MAFKDKPINQWGESDHLEVHIELWTRIRNIWCMMPYIDLCGIKKILVQEITPELEPINDCYLCAWYLAIECKHCPLKIDESLQCHPNYYELLCEGYNKECIDEIISIARQRLDKIKLEADINVK